MIAACPKANDHRYDETVCRVLIRLYFFEPWSADDIALGMRMAFRWPVTSKQIAREWGEMETLCRELGPRPLNGFVLTDELRAIAKKVFADC